MVAEYVRYEIPEARSAEFELAYARAGAELDGAPQCVGWELARCVEHPERYVVRIEWGSVEEHLHGFRGSPAFGRFLADVGPFVDAIVEMTHYAQI